MELEMNYLSSKIEDIDESINVGIGIDYTIEDIKGMESEKELLENILNKLTEIALNK